MNKPENYEDIIEASNNLMTLADTQRIKAELLGIRTAAEMILEQDPENVVDTSFENLRGRIHIIANHLIK